MALVFFFDLKYRQAKRVVNLMGLFQQIWSIAAFLLASKKAASWLFYRITKKATAKTQVPLFMLVAGNR